MSQAELAEAAGIVQSKISKYENHLIQVGDAELERMARVLGYAVDFFFQTDRVYGLGSSYLFHRRRQAITVGVQKQAQARVNVLRMQIARLLRSVEIDTPNAFVRMDAQEYDGDVARIAQIVRAAWRVPLGPVVDITAAVENAGGLVALCDFGTPKIDAAHLWLPDLPPLFFLHEHLATDRYRFTLAHEIGHAIMHRFPVGDVEQEAHRFAAEFLMPAEDIRPHLAGLTLRTAAALKPHWRVSMAAIIRRAYDLEQITERQYKRLNEQIAASGYKTNEPVPLRAEQPNALRQVVGYHRRSLGYKDEDMDRLFYRADWHSTFGERSQTPMMRISGEPLPIKPDERRSM